MHDNIFYSSFKFVTMGPINNASELVKVTAWDRKGDKLLPETDGDKSSVRSCGIGWRAISPEMVEVSILDKSQW